MRNKKNVLIVCVSVLSIFCNAEEKRVNPNIVFILADDLGYGDVTSCNGNGKIKTPNIDRLAKEGVVFVDAHSSSAVSSPTRYGILTGRYNWRSTLKKGIVKSFDSPIIIEGRRTIADMCRSKGYNTACFGKWHLGMNFPTKDGKEPIDTENNFNIDYTKSITGGPCDVGFDYFFGVNAPNFPPYCYIENRKTKGIPNFFYPVNEMLDTRSGHGLKDWNLSEILPTVISKTQDYIKEKVKDDNPFFIYIPLTSPHTPIVPTKMYKGKSSLNLYADFVMETDWAVGQILNVIDELNISDNTIVVFTSDNGCSPRADFDFLIKNGHNPNYIFRGMKSDLYEGGHHIPCMVRWPGKFEPHVVKQTICLTDFYRTFASIIDYEVPDNEAEDSYDLLPLLKSDHYKRELREATVHHSGNGSFAIRKGRWKLLLTPYSGGWSKPYPGSKITQNEPLVQLYDLANDEEEKNNLSSEYPEIVKDMKELLRKYIYWGRSTVGKHQNNDGPITWKQLKHAGL